MSTSFFPSTSEIAATFADEIAALGGAVSDSYDDGSRLFVRAQLTPERDVAVNDTLKAGVALRAVGPIVSVHPYIYRKVCSNGAIAAQVTGTRDILRVEFASATEFVTGAMDEIRVTVRQCAEPAVFEQTATEMASTRNVLAASMINMLPILERVSGDQRAFIIDMLGREIENAHDGTYYGVMNAITAVGREMRDPETKWQLEVFGGSIPAVARRSTKRASEHAELVAVG